MNEAIAWREDGAEENPAVHVTKRGQEIPIWKMSDKHLLNVLRMIEKRAEGGMVTGSGDITAPSESNVEFIPEEHALEQLNYELYAEEARARGFPTKH